MMPATEESSAPASGGKRVPILLHTAFTIGKLVMVGTTSAVVALSIYARCDPLWLAVRAGVALLVTGLITWAVCWVISRGALNAARSQLREAQYVERAPAFLNKRA
jgi:hypothetical protein